MTRLFETSWRWRRLATLGVLVWAMAMTSIIVVAGLDTGVARDALGLLSMIILGVLGTYTGAATWDDRNRMVHGRIEGRIEPPPPFPPSAGERG